MGEVAGCRLKGFHPHSKDPPQFTVRTAVNMKINSYMCHLSQICIKYWYHTRNTFKEVKHRFFSICRFASTLWWRTRKRQFWTSGDRGRKGNISVSANHWAYLYLSLLEGFFVFIYFTKRYCETESPSATQFAVSRFSEVIEMFQWCFVFFLGHHALSVRGQVFFKNVVLSLSSRGRPLSRHAVVWGCYNVNWFQDILKGSCVFVWFAFWYHLQSSF